MQPIKDISGNALVFQSGGPTRVINASLVGVYYGILSHIISEEARGKTPRIQGLIGTENGVAGLLEERVFDLLRESEKGMDEIYHTPASCLKTTRHELYDKETGIREDECKRAIEVLKAYNMHYLFTIGGGDSAETALILSEFAKEENYPLIALLVPKTIDNDLLETDHCPGYGSAARFVTSYIAGTHCDIESYGNSIEVDVTMGRNAGWLTASASLVERLGISQPLIFVPENPLEIEDFLEIAMREYSRRGICQAVVSEGMKTPEGEEWVKILSKGTLAKDMTGRIVLSRTPLANLLEEELRSVLSRAGIKARVVSNQLGYGQRSFLDSFSRTDLREAEIVGRKAVDYALQGKDCVMVALKREPGEGYECNTIPIGLSKIASPGKKRIQTLKPEYIDTKNNKAGPAFLEYASPLVDIETMRGIGRLKGGRLKRRLPVYKVGE